MRIVNFTVMLILSAWLILACSGVDKDTQSNMGVPSPDINVPSNKTTSDRTMDVNLNLSGLSESQFQNEIIAEAHYGLRNTFLLRAAFQWQNHWDELSSITLTDASRQGYLPFWLIDPDTGKTVMIFDQGNPQGSSVVLLPDKGALSCKIIPNGLVKNQNAEPVIVDNSEFISQVQNSVPSEGQLEIQKRRAKYPPTAWHTMMDGFNENMKQIMLLYLAENARMPESMGELFNGKLFFNEDFLKKAKELIESGESSRYECGIIPEHDILYFDYDWKIGDEIRQPFAVQYFISESGFQLTDNTNRKELLSLTGLPNDSRRVVLLSDTMLANPVEYLGSISRPLSDFYMESK